MVWFNLAAFGFYQLGTGVRKQWIEKNLCMTPSASPLAMVTSNFFNVSVPQLAFNSLVLFHCGKAINLPIAGYLALGLGSALFAAFDMRSNHAT